MRNLVFLSAIFLLLGACGGSSSSRDQTSAAPLAQGTLTLLVGDGPREDFDQILLTITGSRLIGGSEHTITLDAPITVDLLKLRNLNELLVQAEVPAGSYSKIRLFISDMSLIKLDSSGGVLSTESPPLPANGHIDLNPQGNFEVAADADTVIEIDFDLDRSLHIKSTGNGSYRFRPVVFVDVLTPEASGRLVMLSGELRTLADDRTFELCTSDEKCINSQLVDAAPILDMVGESATGVDAIIDRDIVTVFGRFEYDNTDGSRVFNALALVQAAADDLTSHEGNVVAPPVDNLMELTDDAETFPIQFVASAIVLGANGLAGGQEDIVADQAIEVWGITPPDSDVLNVIVAKLGDLNAEDVTRIEREGTFVSLTDRVYRFTNENQETFCAVLGSAPSIFEVMSSTDSTDSTELTVDTLVDRLSNGYYADFNEVEFELKGTEVDAEQCLVVDELVIEIEES